MKKITALVLLMIMCFSLVACGNKAEKEIVGEWRTSESSQYNSSLIFNEDGTGTYSVGTDPDRPMKWKYDSELASYIYCLSNGTMGCIINIKTDKNGKEYFIVSGTAYYRVDN